MTTTNISAAAKYYDLQQAVKMASLEDISNIISKIARARLDNYQEIGLLKSLKKATDIGVVELKRDLKNQKEQQKQEAATGFKKMDVRYFPDTKISQHSETPLETISNIQALLEFYEISARYNLIKKKEEIFIPGSNPDSDNKDNCALAVVTSLANLNKVPSKNIKNFLSYIACQNEYNPVVEWIDSTEWDGVDRFQDICGTLILREGFPEELKSLLLRKWLISAIAAAFSPRDFRSRGVLTLQGPQSIGKTSWLLSLVEDYLKSEWIKSDHLLDPTNKDSILSAIEHWLVELGELESSFKKDIARVKGFITSGRDKIRRPFAHKDSEYSRRTVFFASVNDGEFLVDPTGNTRWWTLPLVDVVSDHKINVQQLWAQVKSWYQNGERWWLDREEERWLESFNDQHRVVNAIRELVFGYFKSDTNPISFSKKSASEVLRLVGIDNPKNAQSKDCGAALREIFGKPTMINGVNKWNVPIKMMRD